MTLEELGSHGVVCFGGEDWWYHNRGHCDMQYMRQYARYTPVLYVNSVVMRKPNIAEGRMFWRRVRRKLRSISRGLVCVAENFWVYSPFSAPVHHVPAARSLNEWLLRMQIRWACRKLAMRRPLVWVNCPTACETALRLPHSALVYQRTDRYEEFPGVDAALVRSCDQRLKRGAALTFFSNRKLHEDEAGECRRAAYVDHGVDYEFFAAAAEEPTVPEEMKSLRHPVAGFYGGIDHHTFDLGLMADVVARLPDVTFVFIGNTSIDCTALTSRPNVVMLGQRPYEQVPHYAKCFDVCLMPWNRNRWIAACNPIKLKEYLALGKPVVSTPFPELAVYGGLVETADDAAEFARLVRVACVETGVTDRAGRQARVREHSWAAKGAQLLALVTPSTPDPVEVVHAAT